MVRGRSMPSFWADGTNPPYTDAAHPALTSFADEVCATVARVFAYVGTLALFGILGIHLWNQYHAMKAAGPAAKASWTAGWSVAHRSHPAFAVSQVDAADKSATYTILRHPEGGRNRCRNLWSVGCSPRKGPILLARTLAAVSIPRGNFDRSEKSQTRAFAPGSPPDLGFVSIFVTTPDRLKLHVRSYGSRTSALPVVCLPGLARTAADFHSLAVALAADPAQPRWVVAPDYRGHGQSEYDRNPDNYALRVDLADLSAVLTALTIPPAIFVGTSHGGVLAMMLAVSRPAAIAGVILNDIGPVIEPRGLLQIKGYVGKLPIPRDFAEGAEILRWLFTAQFPKLVPQDWVGLAQRTWREHGGGLVPDYDVRLARTLQADWERSPPTL